MTYNTTKRKPLRGKRRQAFFDAHGGICIFCLLPILPGEKWQDCHIIARELKREGADDLSNRGPGHIHCHKADTKRVAALVARGNSLIKNRGRTALQVERPPKREPRMKSSRGFQGSKPMGKSPGFRPGKSDLRSRNTFQRRDR